METSEEMYGIIDTLENFHSKFTERTIDINVEDFNESNNEHEYAPYEKLYQFPNER